MTGRDEEMVAPGRPAHSCLCFCLSIAAASLFLGGGCQRSDLVEAELRTRERQLRDLKDELNRAACTNEALVRELQAVHQGAAASPELASQTYTLKQIVLGRGTGGYDDDHCPGDEGLQVVLEPKDCDGHTIKTPGALHVEALEINAEGLKIPVSTWDVPPAQLQRTWRSGFISTGYFVVLPWQNWPSSERMRVTARFLLADGRIFEADKDITIRLTPAAYRKLLAPSSIIGPPVPARPGEAAPLPAPRTVGPEGPVIQQGWWEPARASPMGQTPPRPSVADEVQLARPGPLDHAPGEANATGE
jgi:hypothetical protein